MGSLTRYNNVAEMYLIVSCFLITAAVLLLAFRRGLGCRSSFVPVALLIFSFRQYENMLFGFQISFAFTQTFGVLALYLLYSSNRDNFRAAFAAALGSATIASFSTAQGLLVWPAGLLGLLLGSVATSGKKVFVGIWGIVGVAEWVAYFVDYKTPQGHPPLLPALGHIGTTTEYFLTLLGSALFWQAERAYAGGLVIGCLALAMLLATYGRGCYASIRSGYPFFSTPCSSWPPSRSGAQGCSGFGRRPPPGTRPSRFFGWRASTRCWQRWYSPQRPASLEPCYSSPYSGQYF